VPSTSARPSVGPAPQQVAQLSQQQLQYLHAQYVKAHQQQQLEQQIFAQYRSQPTALSVVSQYEHKDQPVSSTALSFSVPASDAHHAQDILMRQVLHQQMYDAAVAQQQQQMKSTVSAGAINLMQQQASETSIQQPGIDSHQFRTLEADHLSAMRRASEGQVHTSIASCVVTNVEPVDSSQSVTSTQSTDVIPTQSATYTDDDPPSRSRDETFKVPFPPDHVCCKIFDHFVCDLLHTHTNLFNGPLSRTTCFQWELNQCQSCGERPFF